MLYNTEWIFTTSSTCYCNLGKLLKDNILKIEELVNELLVKMKV